MSGVNVFCDCIPQPCILHRPGVKTMMEVQANLDAAHECKWKALAGELVNAMEFSMSGHNKKQPLCESCNADFEILIAKAREAGL